MAEPAASVWALSRRAVLRYSAIGTGLLALARLRPAPVRASTAAPAGALSVLTARDAGIMTAIGARLVFSGNSGMPTFGETHAIETIDQSIVQLEPRIQGQLRWLLRAVEYGPPLLQCELTTFTAMPPAAQDVYLEGWATGGEARRLAFRALKNLAMLGYYAQDDTWKGIHYGGPWAPRPRRAAGEA
jgi:hypothetical protein